MQGAQSSFSGHRGVGRYTRELAKALLRLNSKHEIILALNGAFQKSVLELRQEFGGLISQRNIKVWRQPLSVAANDPLNENRIRAAQLIRESFLKSLDPDVILSTNLQEGLVDNASTSVRLLESRSIHVSTLHDVVPLFSPEKYLSDPNTRKWYEEKIAFAKASDLILTVSESSKRDIIRKLGVPPEKVAVTYNAVDTKTFHKISIDDEEKGQLFSKFGIEGRFILYSGGNDAHKNLKTLYRAFSQLPEDLASSVQLVMVGRELKAQESSERRNLRDKGLSDARNSRIVFAGYVSDADLVHLMNLTSLFVFPSLHEGFGLPPLEAMACGAPVIASDASSLPEIVGLGAAMFNPESPDELARLIEKALIEPDFASLLRANGDSRVERFSWERTARSLVDALERSVTPLPIEPVPIVNGNSVAATVKNACLELADEDLLRISESIAESFDNGNGKSAIYLDVSSIILGDHRSGIQRVVRALCKELLNRENGSRFVPVYTSLSDPQHYVAQQFAADCLGKPAPELSIEPAWVDMRPGDVLVYLDLHPSVAITHRERNIYLRQKGLSVLHVVYDLIPYKHPEMFWPELCEEFENWIETISHASGALCISNAVASDVMEWMSSHAKDRMQNYKIRSFHLGADIDSSVPTKGLPENAQEVLKQLASRPTFLMVGTIEPRKGYKQAFRAFELLWDRQKDWNIVMIGRKGWQVEELCQEIRNHEENGKRLHWIEGCSDEFLELIYQASTCLIAASEAEGFGLPLIEAARHKLPIVARDIEVFREVAGDAAFYFEGSSARALADSLEAWLDLHQRGTAPPSSGMKVLAWEESAHQFIQSINECAGEILNAPLKLN